MMRVNEIGPTIEQPLSISWRVELRCIWFLLFVVVASLMLLVKMTALFIWASDVGDDRSIMAGGEDLYLQTKQRPTGRRISRSWSAGTHVTNGVKGE